MEEQTWIYERLKEDGKVERVDKNRNDFDGKLTGKIVFGVKEWFDENPEERKARGWIKHITHTGKGIEYNRQTQFLCKSIKTIDEYTVEDEFHILDKSEEQMRLEEVGGYDGTTIIWGWDDD